MVKPLWALGKENSFDQAVLAYTAGDDIVLDQVLVFYDCLVNQAHQLMLAKVGLLSKKQVKQAVVALDVVKKLHKKGTFEMRAALEDVHSNIEAYVSAHAGPAIGGNLGFGLSRNELVMTDTRMFLREKLLVVIEEITACIEGLLFVAKDHVGTIMPSFEHGQPAQPITYAHWLLSKCYQFLDDEMNLEQMYNKINLCPLGMNEQAGTHLPLDEKFVAQCLGFDDLMPNSLYAVGLRGELELGLLGAFVSLGLHIGRIMHEVISWSSVGYQFVEIDSIYTTGATAAPGVKNPDTLEIVRAKCASLYSAYLEVLMIMDSLPSGYNRDSQQTKPVLFQSVEMVIKTLPVFADILKTLKINTASMREHIGLFSTAGDVTSQLAWKTGLPFRDAYKLIQVLIDGGSITSFAQLTPAAISQATVKMIGKSITLSKADIAAVATAQARVNACVGIGGPSPSQTKRMLDDVQKKTGTITGWVSGSQKKLTHSFALLEEEVAHFVGKNI
ncbi:argininosuccinate lyase [Candidatus Gottesmanbacteria bacterium]|nr:argininosuccinate lyase [Candidatus Gottesmanbacteria bacterium]